MEFSDCWWPVILHCSFVNIMYNVGMQESTDCQKYLTLENIDFVAQDSHILSNISLTFCRHQLTLIVGASGSGKSTLLKIINGLISPTRGRVIYEGKNIEEYLPEIYRSKVMLVGQKPFIAEGTARDNILLPLTFKTHQDLHLNTDQILEVLNELGMDEDFLEKKSSKLSGGEGQRMALARALLLKAETLLLDEPTSALDISSQDKIIRALQKLKKKVNIIVVAHSAAFINSADHIIMIKKGKVVSCGQVVSEDDLRECLEHKE